MTAGCGFKLMFVDISLSQVTGLRFPSLFLYIPTFLICLFDYVTAVYRVALLRSFNVEGGVAAW